MVCGESGGANLSVAVALLAKRDKKVLPDGIYAMCPYISNLYHLLDTSEAQELPSFYENEGLLYSCSLLGVLTRWLHTPTPRFCGSPAHCRCPKPPFSLYENRSICNVVTHTHTHTNQFMRPGDRATKHQNSWFSRIIVEPRSLSMI